MSLYIDNIEKGILRETCHPDFNLILKNKIYIDTIDEFTPFGNDEGWDTLRALEEWYQTYFDSHSIILDFISSYTGETWGWTEVELPLIQKLDLNEIRKIERTDEFILHVYPQIILATAFGQFKITGKLDDYLKEIAQKVIRQQILITEEKIKNDEIDFSKLMKIVDEETTEINSSGNMNLILTKYLERLKIMSDDLEKIPLMINE